MIALKLRLLVCVYLVEHFDRKPLPALSTFVWLFAVVECLVVLLQVAQPGEDFLALVAPELTVRVVVLTGLGGTAALAPSRAGHRRGRGTRATHYP